MRVSFWTTCHSGKQRLIALTINQGLMGEIPTIIRFVRTSANEIVRINRRTKEKSPPLREKHPAAND
jgi:hypothetical protein